MTDHGPLRLPTVRLAPVGELTRAARDCRRLTSVRRVAEWVGSSRKVTRDGTLTLADSRRAVQDLKLPGDQGQTSARRAEELGELHALWELAMKVELLETDGEVVRPGPALEELGDDEDVTGIWMDVLAVTLDRVFELSGMGEALVPALMAMYVEPAPIPVRDLATVAAAAQHYIDVADTVPQQITAVAPVIDDFVRSLVELDAAVEDDAGVRLTALGQYGVNCWLDAVGVEAPAVADLAGASAADLIGLGYTATGADELDALFDEWTSARGPDAAAHDLVEFADLEGDVQSRMIVFSMLDRIGPAAEPAVRRGLDSTVTRAHARTWLHGQGLEVAEPELAEVQWLFVDTIVSSLDDDTDTMRKAMSETGVSALEHAEMIAGLWRCGHPQATEALDAVARYHPDGALAEAARTAAVDARSAVHAPAPRRTKAAEKSTRKSRTHERRRRPRRRRPRGPRRPAS